MKSAEERKRQFKAHAVTNENQPEWKTLLISRCIHRVKAQRQLKLSKLRSRQNCVATTPVSKTTIDLHTPSTKDDQLMDDTRKIILEELRSISPTFNDRVKQNKACSVENELQDIYDDEEFQQIVAKFTEDDYLNIEEMIHNELINEENISLQLQQEQEDIDEEILYGCMNNLCLSDIDENAVVCPICNSHDLLLNSNVFFCKCGFRLDTMNEPMSLAQLGSLLSASFQNHTNIHPYCSDQPKIFYESIPSTPDIKLLVLKCATCNHYEVVV